MAEQRFSVPPDPTKTAATSEHRSERSEQIRPAMFAPSCRRRWRNNASPFRQIRRRRRQPANIAASGASKLDPRCSRRRAAGGVGGTTLFRSARSDEDGGNPANIAASGASNQTERCSRRRSAGGDGGTTLFRSARSDEDGGNPANIAASGASNQNRARCPS